MQFTVRVAALLALAAKVFAQTADFDPIYTPENGQVVPAGKTFTITWQAPAKYANEKISIHLIGGATQNTQVPLQDIAAGVDNSVQSYQWAVDSSLGAQSVYGLVFKLESNPDIFQYSMPFKIGAASKAETTSAAVATTAAPTTVAQGVKTVSLSSAPVVTEESTAFVTVSCNSSTTAPVSVQSSSVVTVQSSVYLNQTTLASKVPTAPVQVSTTVSAVTTSTPVTTPIVSAGAVRVGAPIAIVGGFMAVLAL